MKQELSKKEKAQFLRKYGWITRYNDNNWIESGVEYSDIEKACMSIDMAFAIQLRRLIKNKTDITINIIEREDMSVFNVLNEWRELIYKSKEDSNPDEELWYEIPALPGYLFKNLKFEKHSDFVEDLGELSFTFKYDDYKKLD